MKRERETNETNRGAGFPFLLSGSSSGLFFVSQLSRLFHARARRMLVPADPGQDDVGVQPLQKRRSGRRHCKRAKARFPLSRKK